jgi:multidrug efflux pump subunit AcrA (membrane-fusion protein)
MPGRSKTRPSPGQQGDFRPVLVLTGSLTALRSEEFKVPITQSWRIQIKWMVKEGDSVKPGDPVVRFDTANLAAELETTQESLRTKREERAQKEADYRHQKFELEVEVKKAENEMRQKEIDASIPAGIESRQEYDRNSSRREERLLAREAPINKLSGWWKPKPDQDARGSRSRSSRPGQAPEEPG